jgi:hypothetical protein
VRLPIHYPQALVWPYHPQLCVHVMQALSLSQDQLEEGLQFLGLVLMVNRWALHPCLVRCCLHSHTPTDPPCSQYHWGCTAPPCAPSSGHSESLTASLASVACQHTAT